MKDIRIPSEIYVPVFFFMIIAGIKYGWFGVIAVPLSLIIMVVAYYLCQGLKRVFEYVADFIDSFFKPGR